MINYLFEQYRLEISDGESCSVCLHPIEANLLKALDKKGRKVYLISSAKEILYIGEADTSIKTRMQRGCTSHNYYVKNGKARNGYQGYKWLDKILNTERNLTLSVAIFEAEFDDKRSVIEAIEAELVFLVRSKIGYWPKFQNEIHFNNNCVDAYNVAQSILKNTLESKNITQ